jgi:hypothetical protein
MLAIADESVDLRIGVAEVATLLMGTGKARRVDPLGGSPSAFHLTPGVNWCRGRSYHRRVGAGEATGRAVQWGAWFEQTVNRGTHSSCFEVGRLEREPAQTSRPRQRQEEAEHEQEHKHIKGHSILAAWNENK